MNDKIKQLMANRIGGRGTIRRKTPNKKRMLKHKPKRISVLEKQYNLIINRINKFIIIKQIDKLKMKQYLIDRFMDFFKNTIKRKDYQKKKVIQNINTFIKAYIIYNYFESLDNNDNNSNQDLILNKNYLLMQKYFNDQGIERINDFMFELWDKLNQLNLEDF